VRDFFFVNGTLFFSFFFTWQDHVAERACAPRHSAPHARLFFFCIWPICFRNVPSAHCVPSPFCTCNVFQFFLFSIFTIFLGSVSHQHLGFPCPVQTASGCNVCTCLHIYTLGLFWHTY
jgi:hypothetical protein